MEFFDFKCKYCGGTLEKVDGIRSVAKCKYCGSKQTLPKLHDEKRANLFERANHFRRNNEFDKAEALYEEILNEDLSDPEAYWSLVLCRFGVEYVQDPKSNELVPTVNRTQFTSIFSDENYNSAIKYADAEQRKLYEHEAKLINDIQKHILEIAQNEEPFDVFLCYKETDDRGMRTDASVEAQKLYRELVRDGYKVFYARETLSDKIGSAYEPYIFSALNSAKVMIVFGTKKEHLEAVWVRNEWSRFLGQIKNGEKKTLIPVYKNFDAYDLPKEFANLQALSMDKIGYFEELISSIEKLLGNYGVSSNANTKNKNNQVVDEAEQKAKSIDDQILAIYNMEHSKNKANSIIQLRKELNSLPLAVASKIKNGKLVDQMYDEAKNANKKKKEVNNNEKDKNKKSANSQKVSTDTAAKDFYIEGKKLVLYKGTSSIVTIPNGITYIGSGAFRGNKNIVQLVIPRSVKIIDNFAFQGCTNLRRIKFMGSELKWGKIKISTDSHTYNSYSYTFELEKYEKFLSSIYYEYTDVVSQDATIKRLFYVLLVLPILSAVISLLLGSSLGLWAMLLCGIFIGVEVILIWLRFKNYDIKELKGLIGVILIFLLTVTAGIFIFINREMSYISLSLLIVDIAFSIIVLYFCYYIYDGIDSASCIASIVNACVAGILLITSIVWCASVWGTQPISVDAISVKYRLDRSEGTLNVEYQDGTYILDKVNAPNVSTVVVEEGYKTLNSYALSKCDSMSALYIPSSVEEIVGEGNVNYSESLKVIYIGYNADGTKLEDSSKLKRIDYQTFISGSLDIIYYNGTMEEWENIEKEGYNSWFGDDLKWGHGLGDYKVVCNDGTLEYNN